MSCWSTFYFYTSPSLLFLFLSLSFSLFSFFLHVSCYAGHRPGCSRYVPASATLGPKWPHCSEAPSAAYIARAASPWMVCSSGDVLLSEHLVMSRWIHTGRSERGRRAGVLLFYFSPQLLVNILFFTLMFSYIYPCTSSFFFFLSFPFLSLFSTYRATQVIDLAARDTSPRLRLWGHSGSNVRRPPPQPALLEPHLRGWFVA